MTVRGVLFDFSGTLFHLEPGASWVDGLAGDDGVPLDVDQQAELLTALTAPSWAPAVALPPDIDDAWRRRDLDPELHRLAYVYRLREAGMDLRPGVAERLYERIMAPSSWQRYPDTHEALRRVRDAGLPVAVVSNIAWDVRETFRLHGVDNLVDDYVLSFVEGSMKPDLKIFRIACERLGVDPADVLMVGDSVEADGAITALGSSFALVESRDTADRPDALISALAQHRVGA